MALPTLVKTWQLSINQTVTAQGSTTATMQRVLRTIKDRLKGFGTAPWTVVGSSNSTVAALDSVDRWTTDANLVGNAAGSVHAWIVLRQTGIATNYEICIDLINSTLINATIAISPSAGFTGGTTTARPTATDETLPMNNANLSSGVDTTHQIHVWQSTDGQCTRVAVWRGSTNMCMFWMFDKPANPVTGWTNPSVGLAQGSTSGLAVTATGLLSTASALLRGKGVSIMSLAMTAEGYASGPLALLTDIGTIANDLDTSWPFFPIGLCSITLNNKGRHGSVFDMWLKPTSVLDGDTFPNDANARQFIAMGPLILPWTGDATAPLLV